MESHSRWDLLGLCLGRAFGANEGHCATEAQASLVLCLALLPRHFSASYLHPSSKHQAPSTKHHPPQPAEPVPGSLLACFVRYFGGPAAVLSLCAKICGRSTWTTNKRKPSTFCRHPTQLQSGLRSAVPFADTPANQPSTRPPVSQTLEEAILRFLIPLLQPIGDFRRRHVRASKGKGRGGKAHTISQPQLDPESMLEWMPEIYDHLTIGFNSTVRRLETLSSSRRPPLLAQPTDPHLVESGQHLNLSILFVCRQSLPDIITSSLPLLLATSTSLSCRAKLVDLSPQAEAKLAHTLQQPRVGVLGLQENTPQADILMNFVHQNIAPVEVPWLDQAGPCYLPVNIKAIEAHSETKVTSQNRKRKQSERA